MSRGLHFRAVDYFTKAQPYEFSDVPMPGQAMSDRAFMEQQAQRIVRSPKLSREQRRIIEERWPMSTSAHLQVVNE